MGTGTTVHVGKGGGKNVEPGAKPKPVWDINWEEADVDPKTKVVVGQKLDGIIYQDGKPVADYVGGRGGADQNRKLLVLIGNVQVKSKTRDATLFCDELRYEGNVGKDGRIRAIGNVRVVAKDGTMNSKAELWATPDLSEVAQPELFGKL